MPIRPGSSWGEPLLDPVDVVTLDTGFEVAQQVLESGYGFYRVTDGPDQLSAIGGSPEALTAYVWDIGVVTIDEGRKIGFTSWVSIGKPFHRDSKVVLNIPIYKGNRLSLKAHPNDGKLEGFSFDLDLRARLAFQKRLSSGAHLPHPAVQTQRFKDQTILLQTKQQLIIDGVSVGKANSVSFEIIPDAFTYVAGPNLE